MKFRRFGLGLVSAGLLLGGCAGDDAATAMTVKTTEMAFSPSVMRLPAGEHAIVVRNTGEIRHTFSLNSLGEEVTVEPGKTETLAIELQPGTYRYVCRILDHEGLGMRGTLRVTAE